VVKMYRLKNRRGHRALRLAASAVVLGGWIYSRESSARADSVFNASVSNWSIATNWTPNGVPTNGTDADILKDAQANYNVSNTSAPDLGALQLAGGTSLGTSAELLMQQNSTLEAGSIYLGGSNTGQNGYLSGTGVGFLNEDPGNVDIDPGGILAVDSISEYQMLSSSNLTAYNEQLAGIFIENSGSNSLGAGSILNNSGTYTIENSGVLRADYIVNSGTFNQSLSSIAGTATSNTSFTNYGLYIFNSATGTFTGFMNNTQGSLVSIASSLIPFSQGILDNGQMTDTSGTGTYTAAITGNGSMIFNGTGSVTLAGTNVYTGTTSVIGGTLNLNSPTGTAANNFGGALQGNVSIGANGTVVLDSDWQIANNTSLTINGGILNLNTYNESIGSLTMNAGQVQQSGGRGLGVATGLVVVAGSASVTGGLRSNSTFNFNVSNNGTLTVNGALSSYNTSTATGLYLTGGGGTLTISGASLLSTIDINKGILQFYEGGTLGGYNTSTTVESAGTLSLNGQTITIGDLAGSGAVALGAGSLTVTSTAGSTFSGTINGTGSLTKLGNPTLILSGNDYGTGTTTVTAGTLTLASTGSIGSSVINAGYGTTVNLLGTINNTPVVYATGTVNFGPNTGTGFLIRGLGGLNIASNSVGGNGQVNVALATSHANRTLLVPSSLTFTGSTNAWSGQLDLTNNDMVVSNGDITVLTNLVKSGFNNGNWKGNGITSSTAAANTTHLTAIGVIQNNNGSSYPIYGSYTALGSFDGYNPAVADVLVKYTYYGDANLDGKVDGSDYSLIDNGYLNHLTGWYNGDFNYDGVVNGSDYTLIDNAFNSQGSTLAAEIAAPTAQLAAANAVPEPATLSLAAIASLALLKRRRPTKI
jgi:fibronectin-binding autotransporter adhesin